MLVARADGLLTGSYGLVEAERRLEAFAEAGADCVYAPLLPDLAAVRRACAAVSVPVNVLAAGPMPRRAAADLAAAGVARISLGSGLARLAHAALVEAAPRSSAATSAGWRAGRGTDIDALLERGAT